MGRGALASGALLFAIFKHCAVYPEVWPAALTALAGLPFAVYGTALLLALQQLAPPEARGWVFGVCFGPCGPTQLLGMLVAGGAADRTSVLVVNVDAVAYLAAAVFLLLFAREHDRNAPSSRVSERAGDSR